MGWDSECQIGQSNVQFIILPGLGRSCWNYRWKKIAGEREEFVSSLLQAFEKSCWNLCQSNCREEICPAYPIASSRKPSTFEAQKHTWYEPFHRDRPHTNGNSGGYFPEAGSEAVPCNTQRVSEVAAMLCILLHTVIFTSRIRVFEPGYTPGSWYLNP